MTVDLHQIALGNQKAFKMLYDQYQAAMYNICLRMLKHEEDATDAFQETFVKVYQNISKVENANLLPAWIKKICINTCLQMIEKKKRIRWEELDESPALFNVNDEADLVREEEFEANIQKIQKAVFELPEKYRIVFNLYAIEDYSHEEISKMLGIANATSRSQYMRAKQKIFEILKTNGHHDGSIEKFYSEA